MGVCTLAGASGASAQTAAQPAAQGAAETAQEAKATRDRMAIRRARIGTLIDEGQVAKAEGPVEEQAKDAEQVKALADKVTALQDATSAAATPEEKKQVDDAKKQVDAVAADTQKASDEDKAKLEKAQASIGCGGSSKWCGFGGALLASYSVTLGAGDRSGQTGHRIISLVVPAIGLRRTVGKLLSADLLLYSSIVSPQFAVNAIDNTGSGCAKKGGQFEDSLPCEGNAALRPYGAALLGVTVGTGSSTLGVLTFGITAGLARTTQDASAFRFYGVLVGTGALYVPVPFAKDPK